MPIIVRSIDEEFKIILDVEEEKVEFSVRQLDYKTKSMIAGLCTYSREGQIAVDATLTCYYNLKYGIKKVSGLTDPEGNEYKVTFENSKREALTDKCVNELLATPFSDNLQWAAREMSQAVYPSTLVNPITGQPIEGVEVIPAHELQGTEKK